MLGVLKERTEEHPEEHPEEHRAGRAGSAGRTSRPVRAERASGGLFPFRGEAGLAPRMGVFAGVLILKINM